MVAMLPWPDRASPGHLRSATLAEDRWRQDGHALVIDDLGEVLDELPSHLVVGTGANGRMRPVTCVFPEVVGDPPAG